MSKKSTGKNTYTSVREPVKVVKVNHQKIDLYDRKFQNPYLTIKQVQLKNPPFQLKNGYVIVTARCNGKADKGPPAVRLEIDGCGGYLGCTKVSDGEYQGFGLVNAGEVKAWKYDLRNVEVASDNKAGSEKVNFLKIIQSKSSHDVKCYINGDKLSWISLHIFLKDY